MLVVTVNSGYSIERHIGTELPELDNEVVTEIQADGDELEFILDNFRSLPLTYGKLVVRWFGDHARFIYHNMPRKWKS